jgi:hypothetical protein
LFFNKIFGILFQKNCNQSPMSPFSHLFLSLTPDYCLRHLHFRLRFFNSVRYGSRCCLLSLSTLQSLKSYNCFMFTTTYNWHNFLFPLFQIWASGNAVYSSCFTAVCLFFMFIHHNIILQIITQYLTCFSQCSLSHLCLLFLTQFAIILERDTCVSTESCNINWWITMYVFPDFTSGNLVTDLCFWPWNIIYLSYFHLCSSHSVIAQSTC